MFNKALNLKDCKTKTARICWQKIQYIGLKTAEVNAVMVPVFPKGVFSYQLDDDLLSDHIILKIGQGGLRNRSTPTREKNLFKNEVMPALAEMFSFIDPAITGEVRLHFREGTLQEINLTTH